MKYLISENKLYNSIFDYINSEFIEDSLDWSYDDDPDEPNEYNKNIINFNGERYRDGYTNDYLFVYIRKEYYEKTEDEEFKNKWLDKAPLLDFTDKELQKKFDGYFGMTWRPIFEDWFKSVYPQFPVKTFFFKK